MLRAKLHQIEPTDTSDATAANGTHLISVTSGVVDGLTPSAPVVPLPAGSTSADVPAGTPVNSIIFVKA